MEAVGVSWGSMTFSILELGVLITQYLMFKKWNTSTMKRFLKLTSLFVILNFLVFLTSVKFFDTRILIVLKGVNALTIVIYLFFLNFDLILSKNHIFRRTPWFLVSVAVAFGIYGVFEIVPKEFNNFDKLITIAAPFLLFLTTASVVAIRRIRESVLSQIWFIALLIVGVFVVGSFTIYFDLKPSFSILWVNSIFLVFAITQYWILQSGSKRHFFGIYTSVEPVKKNVPKHGKYGFSDTEIELIRMTLYENLSYLEMAERRNVAYNTITSQMTRIFKKVRQTDKVTIKEREDFIEYIVALGLFNSFSDESVSK